MTFLRHTIIILPMLGIACFTGCAKKAEEEEKITPLVAVKIARAEEQDVKLTVDAPATVFAREQANVASRITAPILSLGAKKGDRVSVGQVLARLDNRDLVAQRHELAAVVMDAEASLEKMRLGTVPADLERARGQVTTTQAALNQAEQFYERRKQLFSQGAIPNRDLIVSQTDLATARANFDVAQRNLALFEKQSSGRDISIAQSRLDQARGRLEAIDAQLAFSELRSPFAGFVTEQFVFPGDMAQPSASIFTIADLSVAVARAQVPEQDIQGIRIGSACAFHPQDQQAHGFAGRVTVVNQAVDPARRTVEVWCEVPNTKGELRTQSFGHVQFVTGQLTRAVTVPAAAVELQEGSRKGHVMVVESNKAKKREIEAANTVNGRTPILTGLRAGETVIVEGGFGLPDGAEVKQP